jgi:carboxyl-terminal processing protease
MNAIIQHMKRNYKLLLVVLALCVGLFSFMPKGDPGDPEKDKLLLNYSLLLLSAGTMTQR